MLSFVSVFSLLFVVETNACGFFRYRNLTSVTWHVNEYCCKTIFIIPVTSLADELHFLTATSIVLCLRCSGWR